MKHFLIAFLSVYKRIAGHIRLADFMFETPDLEDSLKSIILFHLKLKEKEIGS